MSEQDVRDGLRVAVAAEPALSFDPDALIVRARKEIRRRRALVGAGAATVVVAVTAVAVPTVLGQQRGEITSVAPGGASSGKPTATVTAPPTTSASAKVDIPWPPPNVVAPHYTATQLKQRGTAMQNHLKTQFAEVVPNAKQVLPKQFGGEAEGAVADGQAYLEAFTSFTINGVRTAVDIYTSAPGTEGPPPAQQCTEGGVTQCDVVKQPDGSSVLVTTQNIDANLHGGVITSVLHYRTNGTVVRAAGYNYDPTGAGTFAMQPAVPVTVAQLTALATDPALGI
ncbi:MAG TPA: hypothetical protein VGR06_01240 [Actinophytocola sp.]|uniref:hypothetical protein n=1 Tax=Actinophytocola sp. TaxID=1872138 RepID=UPI002E012217|nr:hypothetical protein [Actinophytocola sp.]